MPGRDTRTRWQGVFARHREGCEVERLPPKPSLGEVNCACSCDPSFYGKVYDRAAQRHVPTKRCGNVAAARNARKDLLAKLEKGELSTAAPLRLREAHMMFVEAAKEARALNKHGRPYKDSSIDDIDECLRKHVNPRLGPKHLADIRKADVQRLVDDLTPKLSGSRVRSIVNAIRSLYRWAQERELVNDDPAARIRLPAMEEKPRDRIATPGEFALLLAALPLDDALPYALAAYAMGRRAQIQRVTWGDIDLAVGAIEWGAQAVARKSGAARRVVPTVKPLLVMLRQAFEEQGRPSADQLVCPPRRGSKSGLLNTAGLADRAIKTWAARELQPIGLHESRHTAATWLDAAGVSPKVASVLMGHTTPERQAGAAQITLSRYTHLMPGAIETARTQLDSWLAAEEAKNQRPEFHVQDAM
jgi:integrase